MATTNPTILTDLTHLGEERPATTDRTGVAPYSMMATAHSAKPVSYPNQFTRDNERFTGKQAGQP